MHLYLPAFCIVFTSVVIGNAYFQKKQFYPAVVFITKSNASMAVIYVQFFMIVLILGKILRKIFLGTLRAAEFEHLLERFWYALTETCLAFTVFRDDFNPRFVALFTLLLFLKSFHWLSEERIEFMERSPIISWLFHFRVAALLTVLGTMDFWLLFYAYSSTIERGPTVQLVFGFEYAILLTIIASSSFKYALHVIEMRVETPWENKAVFLLYSELVIGFLKVILYVLFVIIMAKIYALPMFVFRPMFFTIRSFKKALGDVIMSRRAIRNMITLYPEASTEELRMTDNICIICREDMKNSSKKLPCGHIFHTTCLRSWFQRQQTCPTCRLNILRKNTAVSTQEVISNEDLFTMTEPNKIKEGCRKENVVVNEVTKGNWKPEITLTLPLTFNATISLSSIPPITCNLNKTELQKLARIEQKYLEKKVDLLRDVQLMLDASTIILQDCALIRSSMKDVNHEVNVSSTLYDAGLERSISNTNTST